jgi:hypothetical protein
MSEDAHTCFEVLKPTLTELTRLVAQSPLTPEERAALAVMVAGHFVGVATAAAGLPPKEGAEVICKIIVDAVTRPKPILNG